MTNAEFGTALGVSESYASYLRRGLRTPSAAVLVNLRTTFGLCGSELLDAYAGGAAIMARYLREHFPFTS